jgi:hypothetical protein
MRYLPLALNPDGEKDVLGLWIEQTEGASNGADSGKSRTVIPAHCAIR